MTACATVADLLELTDNPARLSLEKVRRLLGVGTDRARAVRELAIAEVQRRYQSIPATSRSLQPRSSSTASAACPSTVRGSSSLTGTTGCEG